MTIKYQPKATWRESICCISQVTVHNWGKSGQKPKEGIWSQELKQRQWRGGGLLTSSFSLLSCVIPDDLPRDWAAHSGIKHLTSIIERKIVPGRHVPRPIWWKRFLNRGSFLPRLLTLVSVKLTKTNCHGCYKKVCSKIQTISCINSSHFLRFSQYKDINTSIYYL